MKSNLHKRRIIKGLIKSENIVVGKIKFSKIWKIGKSPDFWRESSELCNYKVFGKEVNLTNINWHKDYFCGFEYPKKRYDRIKISRYFDKGIDIKFPWEVSRFYFAIPLVQNFLITKDLKYYNQFKKLIFSWITNNPFCYGINWVCTMEVAIRAINWIVAVNLFEPILKKDNIFEKQIIKSLIQHAEYISSFPEIYKNGHTTNHAISDYVGLLFLALTLKEHPKSEKWLKQAKEGLLQCMDYQVYDDGVDFEGSIPYHRLVLELFGYAALVCRANDIALPNCYYKKLFKMFEYTDAYVDYNGNASQVGDNDSGRVLIFHESNECDHSYLLDLGEHIFDYTFISQCRKRNMEFRTFLPKIQKINIDRINIKPRETGKSIVFESGGAYILKNKNISLFVSLFPVGLNGRGGHNHLDIGSFTLSYKGQHIIVDPGTYTYTRDKEVRDRFRSYYYHNVVITDKDSNIDISENDIWSLKRYFKYNVDWFDKSSLQISVLNLRNNQLVTRKFIIADNRVTINDHTNGNFYSIVHFHPSVKIATSVNKEIVTNIGLIFFDTYEKISVEEYDYSERYGVVSSAKKLVVYTKGNLNFSIRFCRRNTIK